MEKDIDHILSRWFRDKQFRALLRREPEEALAGYDLTPEQQARLLKLKKHMPRNKQEPAGSPHVLFLDNPFSQN